MITLDSNQFAGGLIHGFNLKLSNHQRGLWLHPVIHFLTALKHNMTCTVGSEHSDQNKLRRDCDHIENLRHTIDNGAKCH